MAVSASSAANGGLSPNAIRALMDGEDDENDFADLMTIATDQTSEYLKVESAVKLASQDNGEESDTDSIAISRIKSSYMVMDNEDAGDDDMADLDEAPVAHRQHLPASSISKAQQVPAIKS